MGSKLCSDNKKVPARCYYYLLEWKDENYEDFQDFTNKSSVAELTRNEFWNLFTKVTQLEEKRNI